MLGQWVIESAGTWTQAELPAADIAIKIAKQLGLDGLQLHRTRQIDQDVIDRYDLVIVMEAGHKEALSAEFPQIRSRLYMLSEIVDEISYDIPDPAYRSINPFDVGRNIQEMVTRGRDEILRRAHSSGE